MTDSLRIGWKWPEVSDRLTMLVMVGIRTGSHTLRSLHWHTGPTLTLLIITETDDWAYVDPADHYCNWRLDLRWLRWSLLKLTTGPTLTLLIFAETDDWAYVDSADHYWNWRLGLHWLCCCQGLEGSLFGPQPVPVPVPGVNLLQSAAGLRRSSPLRRAGSPPSSSHRDTDTRAAHQSSQHQSSRHQSVAVVHSVDVIDPNQLLNV